MQITDKNHYTNFFNQIVQMIEEARYQAFQSLNKHNIVLNFNIGETIVKKQTEHSWGKSVVEKLSKDLQVIMDGKKGYSVQSLWNMRQFYLEYKNLPELLELTFEVPWMHNMLIIQKVKDNAEREYYLKATKEMAWSRAVLLNQVKADAYKYYLKMPKQSNYEKALPEHLSEQANEALKSGYNLDFLGVTKPVKERELENLLVGRIKDFLLELGYGFCFIGNQYKLTLNTKEYFLDLLFYHRILKCLVVIELKTVEFQPEFAGKMDFYLALADKQLKQEDDNPSIGIILCPTKDNDEVEFVLNLIHKPIGVAEYRLTKELPEKLQGKLPTSKELTNRLLKIDNELKEKR